MTSSVIIVGGGISGLTVAFLMKQAGVDVTLLEESPRPGGVIQTHREDGWLFEFGPNTVLANPAVDRLISAASLDGERLSASTSSALRFVVRHGALVPLPSTPPAFFKSRLFGLGSKLRLFTEPFIPPHRGGDESLARFVRRRLGREMLDYAVGPFVSGVYAGDPERLSVRHAVRRIHALEQKHGSLIRGAMAMQKEARARRRVSGEDGGFAAAGNRPEPVGAGPRGSLVSFRAGLSALPGRLAERLGPAVRPGARVEGVARRGDVFIVRGTDAAGCEMEFAASRVVTALDAGATARVLEPLTPPDGPSLEHLAEVPYAGVAILGLGFRRQDVTNPLEAFGFLVPRVEPPRILGCLFVSSLFPGRAPAGHVALTVILGGATDPAACALPEEDLLQTALRDLTPLLGISGRPVIVRQRAWPKAIPQYNMGHERFLDAVAAAESRHPGLHVLGNWRNGVSVGDCILAASGLAETMLNNP